MKILFVYSVTKSISRRTPLQGQEDIYFGISYISSVLKQNNNTTQLIVLDKRYGSKNHKTIDAGIEEFKPDIICFTSVFSEFEFINIIAKYVRSRYPDIFRIIGGVHVSINPAEEYLEIYDAICIGEGEFPVSELAFKMQSNDYYYDIPNFWFRKNGETVKNAPRPFIENLSDIPFPDRDIWQNWILVPASRITVLLGRGCPFNCTYCCNHKIRQIAGGKYVRLREVKDIINELSGIAQKYNSVNEFFLEIETCGVNPDWLINLCEELYLFNRNFNTPKSFSTNLRVFPGLKDELVFQSFKKANFTSLSVGLESGNERVRKEILNRDYSNDDIRRIVSTAREYGIKIMLYNIIGLPGETYTDFLDTLSLNQELQPDRHSTSVFFPYPGTDLYEKARKMGLIPENIDFSSERQKAVLDLPGFRKRKIQQSFDSFHFNVYKKAGKRNIFKLAVYFVQIFLGHNFMTNQKLNIIRLSSFYRKWLLT